MPERLEKPDETEIDAIAEESFAKSLRAVTRSLDKKRFWSLVREEIAALGADPGSGAESCAPPPTKPRA